MTVETMFQSVGFSIFTTGLLAVLLGAVILLRNPLAGVTWGLSVIILIFSGLFGIGIEAFWLANVGTVVLLVAGMIVRGVA